MNSTLLIVLGELAAVLALGIVYALLLPRPALRPLFVIATRGLAPAFFIVLFFDASTAAAALVFLAAAAAALFTTFAFLASALRAPPLVGSAPSLRQDVVFYALSSVLWFALLYWLGSRADVGIFSFEVTQRFVPLTSDLPVVATVTGCLPQFPGVLCIDRATPLEVWSALELSGGNLLTLGAAGISPLDTPTRIAMTAQLAPLFVSVFVLTRD